MKCPIDESRMIDYLDGMLERDDERLVSSHLETCRACAEELAGIRAVRELLVECGAPKVDLPGEAFWSDNLERIGLSTWRRPVSWRSRLNRASWRVMAAAALVVMAFLGFSRLGFIPGAGDKSSPSLAEMTLEENATALDSLEYIRRLLTNYTLAAEYLQTLEDQNGESNGVAAERAFLYTSGLTGTLYDGLLDLDDDELDGVMLLLAGN